MKNPSPRTQARAVRHDPRQTQRKLALCASSVLLIAALLALQGCGRGVEDGATANPNAPGRPGTGNAVVTIAPQPESITESPQIGGARHAVPAGISGRGGPPDYPGASQPPSHPWFQQQPGVGLDGGLGAPANRASESVSAASGASAAQ